MADSKGHMAEELLQRAHSPTTASSIFTERIKQRPLLLRPTSPELPDPKRAKLRSKVRDAREQRRAARDVRNGNAQSTRSKKQKPLSAKQKRALQIYAIPKEQRKYELYLPLHELWCTYMREILGMQSGQENTVHQHRMRPVTAASQGPILVSADYHGAILEVVRSRCVTRVGVKGIVLKDTKFTFEIITIGNAIKGELQSVLIDVYRMR